MSAQQRRPTTVEAIVAAIKHESMDRQRMAVLILLLVLIGTLGFSGGYLIGVKTSMPPSWKLLERGSALSFPWGR